MILILIIDWIYTATVGSMSHNFQISLHQVYKAKHIHVPLMGLWHFVQNMIRVILFQSIVFFISFSLKFLHVYVLLYLLQFCVIMYAEIFLQ